MYKTYSTLQEDAIISASCTTKDFALNLQPFSSFQFVHTHDNTVKITDIPEPYGLVVCSKGYNNNYISLMYHSVTGRMFRYKHHANINVGRNRWEEIAFCESAELTLLNGWKLSYGGAPRVVKCGKLAVLHIPPMYNAADVPKGNVILTVPPGYLPAYHVIISATTEGNVQSNLQVILSYTDGALKLYNTGVASTSNATTITIPYIIN